MILDGSGLDVGVGVDVFECLVLMLAIIPCYIPVLDSLSFVLQTDVSVP